MPFSYKTLILALIALKFFYAVFLSLSQYSAWSNDAFSKFLLPPYQPLKYFVSYALTHFWLNFFLGLGAALTFYLFLIGLKKYQERFFEEGETELGFLMALISGWPGFIVFIPLVFIFAAAFFAFQRLRFGEEYAALGTPFLIAGVVAFVFGKEIISGI